jgi:hypothetical protein
LPAPAAARRESRSDWFISPQQGATGGKIGRARVRARSAAEALALLQLLAKSD